MYNQIETILAQYDLEINEVTKGRGVYLCNTNQGKKLLTPFSGSQEKGKFLKEYLHGLYQQGFSVEQIMENQKQEVVTVDESTGEHFILKDYIDGTEMNAGRLTEMEEAVRLLGRYHRTAKKVDITIPNRIKENAEDVVEIRRRHYRELLKVKNYIRNRKKKSEFEQIYIQNFYKIFATAEKSIACLEQQSQPICEICHGDYNQHNIVWSGSKWHIVHFENFIYSWEIIDLANFLRKMLEKNNWDISLGVHLMKAYHQECPMKKEMFFQLYGLLLFPEKFWKITNHYMNSRKSWISERDIDKLKKVIEQETQRLKFMENLFSILQ